MKWFFGLLSRLLKRNCDFTPKEVIIEQMTEPRPLPMGRAEFNEWAARIMTGAMVPNEEGQTIHTLLDKTLVLNSEETYKKLEIFRESQKFALANMLLHLGPTESHKPDAFFIHSLRKFAVNQVADAIRVELREAAKARTALEEAKNETAGGQASGSSKALV